MKNSARPWKAGDKFSASHLNESVDLANAAGPATGGDLEVHQGRNGRSIARKRVPEPALIVPYQALEPLPALGQYKARVPEIYIKRIASEEGLTETTYGQWPDAANYNAVLWNIGDIAVGDHTLTNMSYGMAMIAGVRDGRYVLQLLGGGGGAGLPPAGEQYTGLFAVAQNVWGIDFVRLHGT
jgi:hypothetical protein